MKSTRLDTFKQVVVVSRLELIPLATHSILANLLLFVTVLINSPLAASAADAPKAASSTAQDATVKAKRHKVIEDLPNFHEVHPYLYRGGEPTAPGLAKLKEMGVKTIIDLRAKSERAFDEPKEAEKLGLKYIYVPMTSAAPTKAQVKTLLDTVDAAKENNEPVLVHCAHGSDRTGCMVGIIRVTRDGWKFDDTYKEMRKYWFGEKYVHLRNAVKERATN